MKTNDQAYLDQIVAFNKILGFNLEPSLDAINENQSISALLTDIKNVLGKSLVDNQNFLIENSRKREVLQKETNDAFFDLNKKMQKEDQTQRQTYYSIFDDIIQDESDTTYRAKVIEQEMMDLKNIATSRVNKLEQIYNVNYESLDKNANDVIDMHQKIYQNNIADIDNVVKLKQQAMNKEIHDSYIKNVNDLSEMNNKTTNAMITMQDKMTNMRKQQDLERANWNRHMVNFQAFQDDTSAWKQVAGHSIDQNKKIVLDQNQKFVSFSNNIQGKLNDFKAKDNEFNQSIQDVTASLNKQISNIEKTLTQSDQEIRNTIEALETSYSNKMKSMENKIETNALTIGPAQFTVTNDSVLNLSLAPGRNFVLGNQTIHGDGSVYSLSNISKHVKSDTLKTKKIVMDNGQNEACLSKLLCFNASNNDVSIKGNVHVTGTVDIGGYTIKHTTNNKKYPTLIETKTGKPANLIVDTLAAQNIVGSSSVKANGTISCHNISASNITVNNNAFMNNINAKNVRASGGFQIGDSSFQKVNKVGAVRLNLDAAKCDNAAFSIRCGSNDTVRLTGTGDIHASSITSKNEIHAGSLVTDKVFAERMGIGASPGSAGLAVHVQPSEKGWQVQMKNKNRLTNMNHGNGTGVQILTETPSKLKALDIVTPANVSLVNITHDGDFNIENGNIQIQGKKMSTSMIKTLASLSKHPPKCFEK